MKILLSIVILFLTNLAFSQSLKKLTLVVPKENFKIDILNIPVDNPYPGDVIVLEMRKDTSSKVDYKLWVYALQKFEFKFLSKEEKYYGYFTFKNHMVLIISDNSADFFFTKLNIQTAFKFLSYTPRDEKDPPVSIEPLSYFHEYKNGQFN